VEAERKEPLVETEPWQQVPRAWPAALPLGLQVNPSRAGSGRKRDKELCGIQNCLTNCLTLNSVNANVFKRYHYPRGGEINHKAYGFPLNNTNNMPENDKHR
jgi:hypothetical protein